MDSHLLQMKTSKRFPAEDFVRDMRLGGQPAERAARTFITWFEHRLRWRLLSKGVASQDVGDLINDVMTQVIVHYRKVRDLGAFEAWVYAVADNIRRRHWARQQRERHVLRDGDRPASSEDDDDLASLRSVLDLADWSQPLPGVGACLEHAMAEFVEAHPSRVACIEMLADGWSAEEMAPQLGRSYPATRQFISQCCAKLLGYLRPCVDEATLARLKRGRAETHK